MRAPLLLSLLAAASAASASSSHVSIVVDPRGGGGGGGGNGPTIVVPTLAAAQAALRAALAARGGDADVDIALAAGTHRVPRGGLVLTAADSPAEGRVVAWRGEAGAVVSGGENVTGWALANDPLLPPGVYRAPVPAALLGGNSRQLYVNGRRAPRTSRPAGGVVPGLALEGGTSADCASGACAYTAATADPLAWANAADVEFVWAGVASGWSESRCAVASVAAAGPQPPQANCSVDPTNEPDCGFFESTEEQCVNNRTAAHPNGCCWHEGGLAPSTHWCVAPVFAGNVTPSASSRITMKQPCFWNLVNRPYQPYGGSPPTAVENVRAHLDTPGAFYLDRARGEILYLPLPGEDITTADAVVAVEESLLKLRGASRQSFADVTFSFATWLRPGEGKGIVDQQATASSTCDYGVPTLSAHGCGLDDVFEMTPGSVALFGARDVDFESCGFVHLGAFGASASGGSQRVAWRGCTFADTSGGAVMLGDTASFNNTDASSWDADLSVSDSTMQGAVEFTGATTVFIAYVQNATIEHNFLYNASYSAMVSGPGEGLRYLPLFLLFLHSLFLSPSPSCADGRLGLGPHREPPRRQQHRRQPRARRADAALLRRRRALHAGPAAGLRALAQLHRLGLGAAAWIRQCDLPR